MASVKLILFLNLLLFISFPSITVYTIPVISLHISSSSSHIQCPLSDAHCQHSQFLYPPSIHSISTLNILRLSVVKTFVAMVLIHWLSCSTPVLFIFPKVSEHGPPLRAIHNIIV
jgi:hypothetical protein